MPWWTLGFGGKPSVPKMLPDVSRETESLTAAASVIRDAGSSFLPQADSWQNEVWGYYDSLGEFQYAVDWKSRMMSRVRLFAARIDPGQDEPVRLDDDSLATQLVSSLGGAVEQSPMMADISVQLDVPGEGFVIAETIDGQEVWSVRSQDEIRKRSGVLEIVDTDVISNTQEWRTLAPDHLVIRIYQPHKRFHHMASSNARAARSTMRELELVNRHILAQYLSRLASAGVVVFPEEVSFPVREEFADAPDPFMAEWIEIAAQAIKEPGTASAVIPIPIKVPGEWADKIQHLDFTLEIDDRIIEKRESAIRRLATQINIPAEILTGMGAINHWGAWQLEEGALKTTIAPDAETICSAFTTRYLRPRLAASGEDNVNDFVVWYDLSELSLRPDRSANAVLAYDRLELNGEALRRETGFDEADKPEGEELTEQAYKILLRTDPNLAATALARLTGEEAPETANEESEETDSQEEDPETPEERTEPPTQDVPPPSPDASAIRVERLIRQANSKHSIRFDSLGQGEILHPDEICRQHTYSCPFTQAFLKVKTRAMPGTTGVYECSLDSLGQLQIGVLNPHTNLDLFIPTRSTNGHRF